MKALVLEAPGSVRVAEVARPAADGLALVRVERVGVCGTDASIFKGKISVDYPRIMGTRWSGWSRPRAPWASSRPAPG